MGFTTSHRAILDMIDGTLLETKTARDIVRKAQAKGSIERQITVLSGGIWGTFSQRNNSTGYVIDYPGGASAFPDGTASMSRYADITGVSEARLVVHVVAGGTPDVVLSVEGISSDPISVGLYFIPGVSTLIVGDWTPLTASGAALLRWRISADGPGSVTVGLVQLQGR